MVGERKCLGASVLLRNGDTSGYGRPAPDAAYRRRADLRHAMVALRQIQVFQEWEADRSVR